jgi:hypothetical protein
VFKAVRLTCVSLGFITLVGCSAQGGGGEDGNPDTSKAGSGSSHSDAGSNAGSGGSNADPPLNTDNPDDPEDDPENGGGGLETVFDPNGPTCGASRIEAKQIVVEKIVEIPEEITEEITEEIPETVTEEITVEVTTVKPTVLYIMFDKSMSMDGPPYGSAHLWTPAVDALKDFVDDEASAGLGVALQYFPIGGGSCNGNGYKTPAVPVGKLPAAATAFKNSLNNADPNGTSTPIEGALRGVTEFCKSYQAAHPDEQCVSVLVTDGAPNGCESNTTNLAKIAKDAKTAGVTTFAVGLQGASFSLLDEIAKQGGAPDCAPSNGSRYACDVSSNANALRDALNLIREKVVTTETHTETKVVTHEVVRTVTHTVVRTEVRQEVQNEQVPCEWSIPESSEDAPFDPNKVNIRLTAGDKSQTTFVKVGSADACIANAWHYDSEEQPTRFIACPQTCETIEADDKSQIDILLGCATLGPV